MITGIVAGQQRATQAPPLVSPEWLSVTPTVNNDGFSSSMVVAMPAVVSSGDLLIMHLCVTSDMIPSTPAGWTPLGSYTEASFYIGSGIYYKVASGSEGGGSVSVAFSGNSTSVAQVHRIKAGTFSAALPCVAATPAVGVVQSNPDSPPLTPAWGMKHTLWLSCFAGNKPGGVTITSSPYATGVSVTESASSGQFVPRVMSCNAVVATVTQDPSAWIVTSVTDGTTTGLSKWVAETIAVQPS